MTTETQSDREAAAALAKAVENLPLALEQAAAYIRQTSVTLSDYLKLFREYEEAGAADGPEPTEYPKALATTWSISSRKLKEDFPAAAELLTLCAFLSPDDIPLETIAEGAKHLPESLVLAAANAETVGRAAATLQDYALAKVRGGSYLSLHRFVQAVTRDHLTEDAAKTWAEAAIGMVNEAFPQQSDDVQTWPVCSKLLPHSVALIGHAKVFQIATQSLDRLLNQSGLYLDARAELDEAKKMYEQSIALAEEIYGVNHPEVAATLSNLGEVLRKQDDLSGARAIIERALKIDETTYGSEHPAVAIDLNNLGGVLHAQGDLEGALSHFKRALAIDEARYGPNHKDVAIDLNNIALVLVDKGDLAGAHSHLERAIAIDAVENRKEHPALAIRLNNFGLVLEKQGNLEGARDHFERALNIFRKFLGKDHPSTVKARNNLASLKKHRG